MGTPLTLLERFEAKFIPEPNSGCWLWLGRLDGGYGRFRTSKDPSVALDGAHRVSYRMHCGEIPEGILVCHTCDVRCCVNPEHLFLGTHEDNSKDAAKKGRLNWKADRPDNAPRYEAHHQAVLTWPNVLAIRASSERGSDLAKQYGVSHTQIIRIRKGESWRGNPS